MARSCVISSIAMPKRACRSFSSLRSLRLDGDVERGGGLVGDQQRGFVGERHRDHHALALPAGELVRKGIEPAAPPRRSRPASAARSARARAASRLMCLCRINASAICFSMRVQRVERGHRLLEHHGDAVAAHRAQRLAGAPTNSCPSRLMLLPGPWLAVG